MNFSEFHLNETLQEGLTAMGFEKATPIQEKAIPHIINGKDLIACAQTGTGKTAAFLLPIINKISEQKHTGVNTLIISPTRELAQQIDQAFEGFAYFVPCSSMAVYGGGDGTSFEFEKKALSEGADVIIATPGRLLSHLNLGYVDFSTVEHLILDEADRMLDMGFYDDIMRIIKHLPKERQTLLFSATMPPKIRQLAKEILKEPEEISIAISKPAEGILQSAYLTYDPQKIPVVKHLLKGKNLQSVIIFCSTKRSVKDLYRELQKLNMSVGSIHSELDQSEREAVMLDFRNRKIQILVATDIVSRGIDIDGIELVINFDVPNDAEDYVHRIGRTARAATTGIAITLINEDDMDKFAKIERLIERDLHKSPPPEELGPGPEFSVQKRPKKGKNRRPFRGQKR